VVFQLKVLMIISCLAIPSFWVARRFIHEDVLGALEFTRLRNAWFAMLAVAFLSFNYPLYLAIAAAIAFYYAKGGHPGGRFFGFMLIIPMFNYWVSGAGLVGAFLEVNHVRVLCWAIFLPALFAFQGDKKPLGHHAADWMIIGGIIWPFILQWQVDSASNTMRVGVYALSDMLLPYWIMSRHVRTNKDLREVLAGLVVGVMAICLVAVFEFLRKWLVYDQLDEALGVHIISRYLTRGDTGWLRTFASTGHSLVMGFVCCAALLASMGVPSEPKPSARSQMWAWVARGILAAGLFVSLARGSWVGALAGLIVWRLTSANPLKGMFGALAVGLAALGLLLVLPQGESVLKLLPFVGNSEQENVDYRQRLLEISWLVIQENPLTGSTDYIYHPLMQTLVQGQGIIDIVNVYVGFALSQGLIGLIFYAGAYLCGLLPLFQALMRQRDRDGVDVMPARAVLSVLLACMLIVATAGNVTVIPWIVCTFIGLTVSATRILTEQGRKTASRPFAPLSR
jgi:O-Antigen ligase